MGLLVGGKGTTHCPGGEGFVPGCRGRRQLSSLPPNSVTLRCPQQCVQGPGCPGVVALPSGFPVPQMHTSLHASASLSLRPALTLTSGARRLSDLALHVPSAHLGSGGPMLGVRHMHCQTYNGKATMKGQKRPRLKTPTMSPAGIPEVRSEKASWRWWLSHQLTW